jgi:hypothetical protein
MIPKLSGACYAVRSLCHIINTDTVLIMEAVRASENISPHQ